MKKLLSLLLVFVMVLGMVPTAFATETAPTATVTADKTEVKAGDTITLTLAIDQTIANLMNFEWAIRFDANAYKKTGSTIGDAYKNQPGGSTVVGEATMIGPYAKPEEQENGLRVSGLSTLGDPITLNAGVIATVTFTALDTITAENASFRITTEAMNDYDTMTMIEGGVNLVGASIPVSLKSDEPVVEPAYTVTMAQDQTVIAGETVSIPVTVGHTGDVTTYNAFDMSFTYDADLLEHTSAEIEGMTVTAGEGTVRVQGYGTDRAVGTAPFTLTFTAKATGTSDVKVTSAKVDISANAITADAPDATLADDTTTVTVSGYPVTLPDYFTGASVVQPGDDYTFTAKDLNYTYTVTATMGGESVEVVDNGDGTYTIRNVSGNIVVNATKTAKTYPVTVTGDTEGATYSETATYGEDYVLQVPEKSGYDITVTATVGGVPYEMIRQDMSPLKVTSFTIQGADITGNINIVITLTAQAPTTTSITFNGTGSGDVVGGTTQTATNGTDFTFELTKDEGYDYTVKLGEEELQPGQDGKYTIPGAKLTGEALMVTVEKTAKKILTVDAVEYIGLDGKSMWLVTAAGTVSEGKVLSYDGTPMFWSEKYDAYCWLVVSTLGTDEVKAEAAGKIAEADAEATTLVYDCDVNETGLVDINDAQLVWDLYNAKYDSFELVTMQKFLNADINGDKTVNVTDSAAVVAAIH